jgi:hypothetical protein
MRKTKLSILSLSIGLLMTGYVNAQSYTQCYDIGNGMQNCVQITTSATTSTTGSTSTSSTTSSGTTTATTSSFGNSLITDDIITATIQEQLLEIQNSSNSSSLLTQYLATTPYTAAQIAEATGYSVSQVTTLISNAKTSFANGTSVALTSSTSTSTTPNIVYTKPAVASSTTSATTTSTTSTPTSVASSTTQTYSSTNSSSSGPAFGQTGGKQVSGTMDPNTMTINYSDGSTYKMTDTDIWLYLHPYTVTSSGFINSQNMPIGWTYNSSTSDTSTASTSTSVPATSTVSTSTSVPTTSTASTSTSVPTTSTASTSTSVPATSTASTSTSVPATSTASTSTSVPATSTASASNTTLNVITTSSDTSTTTFVDSGGQGGM